MWIGALNFWVAVQKVAAAVVLPKRARHSLKGSIAVG